MTPPIQEDGVAADIIRELSQTAFACSSITRLSGGTVNFVYRGTLANPAPVGDSGSVVESVIVKHSKAHLAGNEDYLLDVSRSVSLSPELWFLEIPL
jgi:hypothetical protein